MLGGINISLQSLARYRRYAQLPKSATYSLERLCRGLRLPRNLMCSRR